MLTSLGPGEGLRALRAASLQCDPGEAQECLGTRRAGVVCLVTTLRAVSAWPAYARGCEPLPCEHPGLHWWQAPFRRQDVEGGFKDARVELVKEQASPLVAVALPHQVD